MPYLAKNEQNDLNSLLDKYLHLLFIQDKYRTRHKTLPFWPTRQTKRKRRFGSLLFDEKKLAANLMIHCEPNSTI